VNGKHSPPLTESCVDGHNVDRVSYHIQSMHNSNHWIDRIRNRHSIDSPPIASRWADTKEGNLTLAGVYGRLPFQRDTSIPVQRRQQKFSALTDCYYMMGIGRHLPCLSGLWLTHLLWDRGALAVIVADRHRSSSSSSRGGFSHLPPNSMHFPPKHCSKWRAIFDVRSGGKPAATWIQFRWKLLTTDHRRMHCKDWQKAKHQQSRSSPSNEAY